MLWVVASTAAQQNTAQQSGSPSAKDEYPKGAGQELFLAACSECHDPGVATGARLTAEQWKGVVNSMVDRGAIIPDEDAKVIVEYLTAHFGTTLNINQANAGDIERFFPLSKDEAAAVVRYREANGKFKAWDELSKIPEFDVKKIENKKAFVTF